MVDKIYSVVVDLVIWDEIEAQLSTKLYNKLDEEIWDRVLDTLEDNV